MKIRDFDELPIATDGKVLVGASGTICTTDSDLSDIIGDLIVPATEGKVDKSTYAEDKAAIDEVIESLGSDIETLGGDLDGLDDKIDAVSGIVASDYALSADVSTALETKAYAIARVGGGSELFGENMKFRIAPEGGTNLNLQEYNSATESWVDIGVIVTKENKAPNKILKTNNQNILQWIDPEYYIKSETSAANELTTAFAAKQDTLTFAGESDVITAINTSAVGMTLGAGTDLKIDNGIVSINTNGTMANSADMSFVAGSGTYASGIGTVAFGINTSAIGNRGAFAEGEKTYAEYDCHAEGWGTSALVGNSHAEGQSTLASANCSHTEGFGTSALNANGHAEGNTTIAVGYTTHAEGYGTIASGNYAHAEGNETLALGQASHVEGYKTSAYGSYSHAGGNYTYAKFNDETVIGRFNVQEPSYESDPLFVVGNGDSTNTRKDAFVVMKNGTMSATNILTSGINVASYISQLQSTISDLTTLINSYSGRWVLTPEIPGVVIGGRKYQTIIIGNQEWMTENLDYKFDGLEINGESTWNGEKVAWYYDNDETTYGENGNKYGLLYNWYALKYLDDNKATLLPDGWRAPTKSDFDTLFNTLNFDIDTQYNGSTPFRSIDGWNGVAGTNEYGLNVVPAGWKYGGGFGYVHNAAYIGAVDKQPNDNYRAWCLRLGGEYSGQATDIYYNNYQLTMGCSVRLVRDIT